MQRLVGRHAARECLRAKRRKIHKLILADGAKDAPVLNEILAQAQAQHVPIQTAPREMLDRMSERSAHHHGVALEVGDYPYVELDDILARAQSRNEPPFILMLDTLQDPQNLGTLIRAADAVGVHGIIIGERRSAEVTPAVVHASSGATEHLLIAQVVNQARALDELREHDVWIAALQDDPRAQDLYGSNLKGALALIVGNEGDGVRRLLRDKSDFLLRLPMRGKIESLNAAVAGSVALYEALRQRSGV